MFWTIDAGWFSFYLTILGVILMLVFWKKWSKTKNILLLGCVNIVIAGISIYALFKCISAYSSTEFLLFLLAFVTAAVLETIQATMAYTNKPKKEPKAKKERNWGSSKKEEKLNPLL